MHSLCCWVQKRQVKENFYSVWSCSENGDFHEMLAAEHGGNAEEDALDDKQVLDIVGTVTIVGKPVVTMVVMLSDFTLRFLSVGIPHFVLIQGIVRKTYPHLFRQMPVNFREEFFPLRLERVHHCFSSS